MGDFTSREIILNDVFILKKIISNCEGFTRHNLSLCNKVCLEAYKEYFKNALIVLQKYFKFNRGCVKNNNNHKLFDIIKNNNYDFRKIPRSLFNKQLHSTTTYIINGYNYIELKHNLKFIRSIAIKSNSLIKQVMLVSDNKCVRGWENVSNLLLFPMISLILSKYVQFFLNIESGEDDVEISITSISFDFPNDFYKHRVLSEYGWNSHGVFMMFL